MDLKNKIDELNEVTGIISALKTLKGNDAMAKVLAKTPVNSLEMLDFQINALEMFEGVAAMIIIADKEIKELKDRLQAAELRLTNVSPLVGGL